MPKLAPQEVRTFFITSVAWGRRSIFQTDRMSLLLLDLIQEHRKKRAFFLHEFVIMPNHFHLLLTPAPEIALEKSVQLIKGGFSFRAKKELPYNGEIWQPGFTDHRIDSAMDYSEHVNYIHQNPVRANMVTAPELFDYSSAKRMDLCDPAPKHFMP